MVTLTVCIYTFMGQALAYLTSSPQTAIIMASGVSRFNIERSQHWRSRACLHLSCVCAVRCDPAA